MAVTPAPTNGAVVVGRDVPGRVLRISAHPELGLVVLSIWQDERCAATVRIAERDVPGLVHALADALVVEQPAFRAVG